MPRKAGPGRTPTHYEYVIHRVSFRHTANEWQFLLGLKDKNTFYNRLRAWRADPRGHPLSWVFRHGPDAPIEQQFRDRSQWQKNAASPADAAVIRQTVQSDLADIIGEYE
jgi:hypothetical protein